MMSVSTWSNLREKGPNYPVGNKDPDLKSASKYTEKKYLSHHYGSSVVGTMLGIGGGGGRKWLRWQVGVRKEWYVSCPFFNKSLRSIGYLFFPNRIKQT